ncbi:hypothetical protein RFI_05940, partial [Reticulomyxa filosa]
IFQTLKDLTVPFIQAQCVLHKHEILICGDYDQNSCYSYHKIKNEYKFICDFPKDLILWGHCVVKLVDNNKDNNQINLLCFGGHSKYTLIMKYVSVWDNLSKENNQNEWITFKDNNNNIINIEKDFNSCHVVRAVLGGINNNLLFITYYPHYISVFNLNTYQFIKYYNLPIKDNQTISDHCLIRISYNEMLFFYYNSYILINYDEYNNKFYFNHIKIYDKLSKSRNYSYVYVDCVILVFGGCNDIYKFVIRNNEWVDVQNNFYKQLTYCVPLLSEDMIIYI